MTCRKAVYLLVFAVSMVFFAPRASMAQCTTSDGVMNCSDSSDFTTSGQNLFGTGPAAQVSFSGTIGTSWNQSGSAGSISDVSIDGVDLGDYGATVSGSTSGNISLSASAVASGGAINANIPVNLSLQLPTSVTPGDSFTVNSNFAAGSNAGFTTQSPGIGFGASIGFDVQASVGAEACFSSCAGFSNTSLVNTGQQTLTLIQYNEEGPVTSATLGGNQWIALNQNVTSQVTSGSVDLIPDVLTATTDLSQLTFQTTSTATGNGSYTASGMTSNLVGLDLNVVNALTTALALPPLSGSVDGVSYNLISADATLGLAASQQYSMNLNGATLGLQVVDQNGNPIVGDYATLNASGSATLSYPTNPAVTSISIVPTLTLADPTFNTQTGVTLVPGFSITGLSLNAGPLSLGPVFDYSPSIPPSPQLTLASETFALGGFSSETLASTSAISADTTIETSATISTNINFKNSNVTGQSVSFSAGDNGPSTSDLNIRDSNLTGGTFTGAAGSAVSITSDANATQTSLSGVTLNSGAGNTLTTGGDVLIGNSTLNFGAQNTVNLNGNVGISGSALNFSGPTPNFPSFSVLNVNGNVSLSNSTVTSASVMQTNVAGTLTLQNSTMTNQNMQIDSGATVTMSQSSITGSLLMLGGVLTLNGSTFTVPDNSVNPADVDGTVNLNDGSTMHVGSGVNAGLTLGLNGVINVGAGSLLQSDSLTDGGIINIAAGGTFTAGGTVSTNVLNYGGTVNLNGVTEGGGIIANISAFPGGFAGVVNVSGINTLNSILIAGMSAININANATLNFGGTIYADSIVNNGNFYVNQTPGNGLGNSINVNSFLNNGVLSGNNVTFTGNSSDLTPNLISGNVINSTTGQILAENNSTLTFFTNLSNQGGVITVGSGSTIVVLGQLTQSAGSTLMDGRLSASAGGPIELTGGTFSGTGTIIGTLENAAGILSPGNGGSGTLTIFDDYIQDSGGTLLIDIDGFNDFTKLVVFGNVDLDGTLDVVIDDGFLSQLEADPGLLGSTFDFLDFDGSLTGDFTNFVFTDSSGDSLPFDFTWDVSDPSGSLYLTWSTALDCASLGEAILDGDPNAGSCSSNLPADGAIPADFGTAYTGQIGTFGPSTFNPGPLTSETPEPDTLLLLASGLAALAGAAYRKRVLGRRLQAK